MHLKRYISASCGGWVATGKNPCEHVVNVNRNSGKNQEQDGGFQSSKIGHLAKKTTLSSTVHQDISVAPSDSSLSYLSIGFTHMLDPSRESSGSLTCFSK